MEKYEVNSSGDAASNTILIIDDDIINRKILGKIFQGTYSIKEADNGQIGLVEILTNRDQLCAVLLDVMMPEMDGIEVLRHLNRFNLLDELPIFLITAESEDSVMKEAYELGVMDVIAKPVVSYVIQRRVQSVVELFAMRRHLKKVVATQQVELVKQADKIVELDRGLIIALATAVEFRDEESGDHVNRIYEITKYMLENTSFGAGLTEKDINNIALASIMHDVGKISIPDAILTKPGKLTDEEFEIMKTHTVKGVVLLENIKQLRQGDIYEYACDIARHHHERWDGKGYPDGLAGDEISPWAQIVSLADVYDALSCKRVYKNAFPRSQVLQMIVTGQCGIFNPQLLEEFFRVEDGVSAMYENLAESRVF